MRKNISNLIVLTMIAILALSLPVIFAGSKNANGENGDQGTNKDSNELPDQSNHVEGLGNVLGGACCASNHIDEDSGNPYPNECCNPPDILYDPEDYTPGNHCLCFVMRFPLPP
jgi:hypothetical protein